MDSWEYCFSASLIFPQSHMGGFERKASQQSSQKCKKKLCRNSCISCMYTHPILQSNIRVCVEERDAMCRM